MKINKKSIKNNLPWLLTIIIVLIILAFVFYSMHHIPYPKTLPNSNFTKGFNTTQILTNPTTRKLGKNGTYIIPPYSSTQSFYVKGNATISINEEIFKNASAAQFMFNEIKSNFSTMLSLHPITNSSQGGKMVLLNNLSSNMFGVNISMGRNLSNSYGLTGVKGNKLCFVSLSQYTAKSISNPIQVLLTAINTCFSS
jgi:hypothetical protein